MAVKSITARRRAQKRQRGQSMMEFALLIPVIVSMLTILIEIENAITTSIVNQKYARATLTFLMFNERYYMEPSFLRDERKGRYMNRFWAGVDDKPNFGRDSSDISPSAPIRSIGRFPGDDAAQTEYSRDGDGIAQRQKVRIRTTVFTCIPPTGANGYTLLSEGNLREDTFVAGNYPYCRD